MKPLSGDEWFKQEWDIYGQPISIVSGGFAGGDTSFLFDKLKKSKGREEKNDKNYDDYI